MIASTLGSPDGSARDRCGYCHLDFPRDGFEKDSPQWNTRNTVGQYSVYGSPTMNASVGQPSPVSALCLSCHDGTFAADAHNRTRTMKRSRMIGANGLMDDHPISFTYDFTLVTKDRGLNPPSITPSGLGGTISDDLLIDDRLECASCHDIHKLSSYGCYLRIPLTQSILCLTCHDK